jgi:hypothetical protein
MIIFSLVFQVEFEKKNHKMIKSIKNSFHGINGDFIKSFYSKKQADCILYSNEGSQFEIHKEILCLKQIYVQYFIRHRMDLLSKS